MKLGVRAEGYRVWGRGGDDGKGIGGEGGGVGGVG